MNAPVPYNTLHRTGCSHVDKKKKYAKEREHALVCLKFPEASL